MKLKQFIFGLTAIGSLLAGSVTAQNFTAVTQGEKGKCYILTGALGVRGGNLSADGMFVGGTAGSDWTTNVGYVYDIARDTLKITTSADVVNSWTLYAGNNTISRNGQLIEVESLYPDQTSAEMSHASIWAASASLDTIITMAYEIADDPTGERPNGMTINLPYLVNGKTGKVIRSIKAHWPLTAASAIGFGARVNAANNDATILVGHSARPNGAQWAPVFWDLKADTSFFVGTDQDDNGDLYCTNNDGTLIGGTARGETVIIHYNREQKSMTFETVPNAPGKTGGMLNGISETGLAICVQASGNDPGSRETYIYDMESKTLVSLKEYVRELYGLELPIPTFTAFSISDDGRKITGWSYYNNMDVPYLISLDETQIFARPRALTALQPYGEMTVNVSWATPLRGQYTLKGFNVYCDSAKINDELIPATQMNYTHSDAQTGVHDYTVQAVYEEGVSNYCVPVNMLVIAGDGCLPVQEIGHNLVYNRTAAIYWGLPSAKMSQPMAKTAAPSNPDALTIGGKASGRTVNTIPSKSYQNENLDVIGFNRFESYYWACALLIGNRLYATQYNSGTITVFDPDDMSVLESHTIDVPAIRNMVYVNDKLYLATGEEKIVVLDFKTMSISNELQTKGMAVQHLSYIPTLNDGKGGFAYGTWEALQYCDLYGRAISTGTPSIDIDNLLIAGTAYHNGLFFLYSQTGSPQSAEIYTIDFEKGQYLRKQNLGSNPRMAEIDANGYGFIAGGLSLNTLADGTIALAATLQMSGDFPHIAFLEVEASERLLGFNLYRSKDGGKSERVNPEGQYIKGLSYSEDLLEPGKYVYTVEAVNEGNCKMMLSNVKTEVTIEPIGECVAPKTLKAEEQAKAVRLDWDYESPSEGPSFVGFNIYRDNKLLAEHIADLKYTDFNLAKGDYTYRVEAFYNNSCVASKEAKVTVTHEGVAMPPAHLVLSATGTEKQSKRYNISATWDLPYYESPLAIGYCNMPYNGTGLKDGDNNIPVYALIGWDTAGLAPFKDYYVVGIEYFIGEDITSVEGLLYLNDTLAYQCPSDSRIQENAWNTLLFNHYFSMNQPSELLVGYKVTYRDGTKPVAVFDMGPANTWFGDILSGDGKQWTTLTDAGINANWCINALVVDKRDLEEATTSSSLLHSSKSIVKVMSLNNQFQLTEPKAIHASKSSSASVKLQGFNIYREEEKLNNELLKGFSYQDMNVEEGVYEYRVSAVYSNDKEIKGDGRMINLSSVDNMPQTLTEAVKVFPNPTNGVFRIQGEYLTMEIANLSGAVVRRYTDRRSDIDASDLTSGLYMLRFTLPDGTLRWQKIVIE
ncbi:MAG: T9SS type A sorting domain-containing protein [Bacteroides sp.]|nr:T9SS type A sorting domain-containing protein [Ruminococcus flavefaciens]MCM1555603.1 T9SS type A sorting domain-containing protein [Bacteroides sp.]